MRERLPALPFWFFPAAVALILGAFYLPPWEPLPPAKPPPPIADFSNYAMPFVVRGIAESAIIVPANQAKLDDDAVVIGVQANGQSRAYALNAFASMFGHVFNDVLGGTAVSVTYCDRTQCTRVFTQPGQAERLDLDTGGWTGQELLLKIGSVFYRHQSTDPFSAGPMPKFPYADQPFVVTSWKQWRQQHPETDVYLGPRSDRNPDADDSGESGRP